MTNKNKIPSPEEIRNCLPDMEYFTQESEGIASVITAIEDGILGGCGDVEEYTPAISLLRKKAKKLTENLVEYTRIVNNLNAELYYGKYIRSGV